MKKHWTPKYILTRIREYIFRITHPDTPWLTPAAIDFLDTWLTRQMTGIELGSGRSTAWLAKRCLALTSVESNDSWHQQVSRKLEKQEIRNVKYLYAPKSDHTEVHTIPYLKPIYETPDNSVDFILVDGDYRDLAAVVATHKVAPGGIVIVDNCNWFLPSTSQSPSSVPQHGAPASTSWEEFLVLTHDWERKWTSNGVSDTVFFFKPINVNTRSSNTA